MDNIGATGGSASSSFGVSPAGSPMPLSETPSVRTGAGVPVEGGSLATRSVSPAPSDPGSKVWVPGGLYAAFADGTYTCFKVLVVDDDILHLKPFFIKYEQQPPVDECMKLDDLSKQGQSDDDLSGDDLANGNQAVCQCSDVSRMEARWMEHIPMPRSRYEQMDVQLITTAPVVDKELRGYRDWLEYGGGCFF